jgi:hypothetical protein
MEGGRIGLLDFGCSKRFDHEFMVEHRKLFSIPVGDRERLLEHYRKFHLVNENDPRQKEKEGALLRMQKVDISKYHEDRPFDFSDGAHLKEVLSCLQELARQGLTTPGFVLYLRAKLGLYTLFHQMGARINCYKVLQTYV